MTYCEGCNTHWHPTGCDIGLPTETDWHARCPHPCGICSLPITGRTAEGACGGHTRTEHDALMARIRGRVAS